MPRSTALHARLRRRTSDGPPVAGSGAYLTGPLARLNLGLDRLGPRARQLAAEVGFTVPCDDRFLAGIARGLELLHAFEEALRLIDEYCPPPRPFVEVPDGGGRLGDLRVVSPTSQNLRQIEQDRTALAPHLRQLDRGAADRLAAQAVRSYDRCWPCATQ